MGQPVLSVILAAAAMVAVIVFLYRRKRRLRKARNEEQIDRKKKEEALDRAISNDRHKARSAQAQTPMTIHYNNSPQQENGGMLRLTEQAESMTKEYLFRQTELIFLGEEYGRAAVFQERADKNIYCEIFPYHDGVYVRRAGSTESRLIRGKNTAALTETAIRLRTGDKIETRMGVFLVEFI